MLGRGGLPRSAPRPANASQARLPWPRRPPTLRRNLPGAADRTGCETLNLHADRHKQRLRPLAQDRSGSDR
eukprot:226594-Alexandrium_andersonii.AAC.1